ncbi:hypothetical protein H4S02_000006 [Coemansia sp. RSA 2611]|nr:hypothetical protein IWW52_003765 [Coemansia sp. RSA 2704]KAJ2370652.1 hypothetical protein H4S01_000207 [Coemansia sp. RSA 2610]KAJ2393707.1 hypothetical protein H4S02_000006 [Coemansia sp. RSA 2611]KAJ2728286.1 hypothetical protein H4R23_003678 [Coemansia sp. Cherry 401B]
MSSKYTCNHNGSCVACDSSELQSEFCLANGYKQPLTCTWLADTPQEYKDKHQLPAFTGCDNLHDLEKRAFLRNHLTFVVLGFIAFGIYAWRRKRLYEYQSV